MSADELIHYWTGDGTDPSACGVDVFHTPYTYGSPEWDEVTCADCSAMRPRATGPSVPPWIPRAMILVSRHGPGFDLTATTSWRATRTQVVVTDDRGIERRFRLTDLGEIGAVNYPAWLVSPDDPRVLAAARDRAIEHATASVLVAVNKQRLQDGTQTLDQAITKLEAVRMAATEALASLADLS